MENGFIFIGDNIFSTLFAISTEEQAKGLMFEPYPPPVMSFIYSYSSLNRFWMRNTPSPLDIIFCNKGKVIEICKGEPYSTQTIGGCFSDLVIELPYGTVKNYDIKLGDDVGIIKPTAGELKKIISQKIR